MKVRQFSYRLFTYLFVFGFSTVGFSQNYDAIDVPFRIDGHVLESSSAGGFIAPQFGKIDINLDGKDDILVLDKAGNTISPMINFGEPGEIDYRYDGSFIPAFPPLLEFLVAKDFDRDGRVDLFSLSPQVSGIAVYRNISENGVLAFEQLVIEGFPYLPFFTNGNYTNIYVANTDLPVIEDMDGDGDYDILSFDPEGSNVYLYQNMQIERNRPATALEFIRGDACFGGFYEDGFSESITLGTGPSDCANGLVGDHENGGVRHAGSTMAVFDRDGDGDYELILGDLANAGLVGLFNAGSSEDAYMNSQDLEFPAESEAVSIGQFVAPFVIDINNDGKDDLVATPNNTIGPNRNHIWYYENVGTGNSSVFELKTKNLFLEEVLSHGLNSHPTFADINADGLIDLVVGSNGIKDENSNDKRTLYHYQNVGSKEAPIFELVTDNYQNVSFFGEDGTFLTPTFGDLDGDGDQDLLVGNNIGYFYYWENTAGVGNPIQFAPFVYQYQNLKPGNRSKASIFDVDGDGLADIASGERNDGTSPDGDKTSLNFYKNQGSLGNPMFDSDLNAGGNTPHLGVVHTRDIGSTLGHTAPTFFISDNQALLLAGSGGGFFYLYDEIRGNLYDAFNLVTDSIPIPDQGSFAAGALADLDNDNYYELAAGNLNGGLRFYNTPFLVLQPMSVNEDQLDDLLTIYPNPARNQISLQGVSAGTFQKLRVISTSGQVVLETTPTPNVNIQQLKAGIYILELIGKDVNIRKTFTKF